MGPYGRSDRCRSAVSQSRPASFPSTRYVDGKITNVQKVPAKKPVDEYLKLQGRFRHLFKKGVPIAGRG
ncbi:MAG: hypothetical protein MZV70_58710 [Desulfobacterales bacterium]|nr:hypothetical protein [Desulfobacterales bacterium]